MKNKVTVYKLVDRLRFVNHRYGNFQQKKLFIKEHPGMEKYTHMTDLDAHSKEFGCQMKDVVICDRCQKNIKDHNFVMVSEAFCYHLDCVRNEVPADFENVKIFKRQVEE